MRRLNRGAGFAGMGRGSSQGGQRSVGSVAGFHSSRPGAGNVFAWALTTKMLTSQRRVGDHRAGELRPSAMEIVRGGKIIPPERLVVFVDGKDGGRPKSG